MPSPRRTDAGLHRTKKSGWLSTENDEGSASPTAATAEFEFAAREKNSMPVTRGGNRRHLDLSLSVNHLQEIGNDHQIKKCKYA
ncbi:unnamed protein product [Miscanthus lutarioriparius]|uniref:Uncharacterized protein n=1 Tax=Miscanthus lutarioriparius TaxID=422564 RepID=A0A811MCP8_9POAL|nr:unnamed protein product [Miscanthus lutarioriparius]